MLQDSLLGGSANRALEVEGIGGIGVGAGVSWLCSASVVRVNCLYLLKLYSDVVSGFVPEFVFGRLPPEFFAVTGQKLAVGKFAV